METTNTKANYTLFIESDIRDAQIFGEIIEDNMTISNLLVRAGSNVWQSRSNSLFDLEDLENEINEMVRQSGGGVQIYTSMSGLMPR